MPATPNTEDLRRLAPLELALCQALVAQQVCWDAEALVTTFTKIR